MLVLRSGPSHHNAFSSIIQNDLHECFYLYFGATQESWREVLFVESKKDQKAKTKKRKKNNISRNQKRYNKRMRGLNMLH